MESVGTVISLDKNIATVSVRRVSACGENCTSCKGACVDTKVTARVENTIGARPGDTVMIESNTKDLVRASMFLYIMPIVVAIIVSVITYSFEITDIFVILASVISFFASFIIVKLFEKKLVPKSYIKKILSRGVN